MMKYYYDCRIHSRKNQNPKEWEVQIPEVSQGTINVLNKEQVEILVCINLDELKKLPYLPNVKLFYCRNCPELEELPNWPKLTYIECSNCPKLSWLPEWPKVKNVKLNRCDNIKELPCWIELMNVEFFSCNGLKSYPNWPKVEKVNILLLDEELPLWIKLKHFWGGYIQPLKFKLPLWPEIEELKMFPIGLTSFADDYNIPNS